MEPDSDFYTRNFLKGHGYEIGRHTYGRPRVYDWQEGTTLIIGDYTSIADDVIILLGGNHRADWGSMYPFPEFPKDWPKATKIKGHSTSRGSIVIGNDVWIGYGATILSGVNIGDGAVIGARAVVVKDIPPYSVAVGNPARVVRKRFDDHTIEDLLRMAWWKWPKSKVEANLKILCSDKVKDILDTENARTSKVSWFGIVLKRKVKSFLRKLRVHKIIRYFKK